MVFLFNLQNQRPFLGNLLAAVQSLDYSSQHSGQIFLRVLSCYIKVGQFRRGQNGGGNPSTVILYSTERISHVCLLKPAACCKLFLNRVLKVPGNLPFLS